MKISSAIVKQFESDQKQGGTKVAIQNVVWQLAASLLRDIGVKGISTSYSKTK